MPIKKELSLIALENLLCELDTILADQKSPLVICAGVADDGINGAGISFHNEDETYFAHALYDGATKGITLSFARVRDMRVNSKTCPDRYSFKRSGAGFLIGTRHYAEAAKSVFEFFRDEEFPAACLGG